MEQGLEQECGYTFPTSPRCLALDPVSSQPASRHGFRSLAGVASLSAECHYSSIVGVRCWLTRHWAASWGEVCALCVWRGPPTESRGRRRPGLRQERNDTG